MSPTSGTFIHTGASRGIGLAIAQEYVHAAYPFTEIYTTVESLDLSSLDSVRQFASGVLSRVKSGTIPPIRALLLNAGMQETTGLTFTADGYETTFAVNYLANFLLILLLLPAMDKEYGRVVFVSSTAHDPTHWLNQSFKPAKEAWCDPEMLARRRPMPDEAGDENNGGLRRYGASKLWTIMFMYEIQRRLNASPTYSKISVSSVNPGAVAGTGLTRTHGWLIKIAVAFVMSAAAIVMELFMSDPPFRTPRHSAREGACFQEDGATFGDLEDRKAAYFDGKVRLDSSLESRDRIKQQKLWEGSLGLVGLKETDLPL